MNRRDFLAIAGAAGGATFLPQFRSLTSMYRQANAAVPYSSVNITNTSVPDIMPQVINIFLYGGASELAGNLSNMAGSNGVDQNSQNSYSDIFPGIVQPQSVGGAGQITPRGFWGSDDLTNGERGAGGDAMEFLVSQNHMTVYRTLMKRKNPTGSHRPSLLMSQKGSLDFELGPGIGTRLAAMIASNKNIFEANTRLADGAVIADVESLVMPFVSLEGNTRIFSRDFDFELPLTLRNISLDEDLNNPFTRKDNNDAVIFDGLVNKISTEQYNLRYAQAVEAFRDRETLAAAMADFAPGGVPIVNTQSLPVLTDTADITANGGAALLYPDSRFNRFSERIRAAVTLAIENPSTLFISIGGGFGGWDDHNNGIDEYPDRMRDLFDVLRVAMMHIKYSDQSRNTTPIRNLSRTTSNIIINVYGEFGRRVNLNNSLGWEHGNCQNLYTLGGARPGLRTPAGSDSMGNIVGTTVRTGPGGTNNQYTEPATGSYEFEPMSVASNIYKHFGATNPEILTADPTNPAGDLPIDEDPTTNGAV